MIAPTEARKDVAQLLRLCQGRRVQDWTPALRSEADALVAELVGLNAPWPGAGGPVHLEAILVKSVTLGAGMAEMLRVWSDWLEQNLHSSCSILPANLDCPTHHIS